LVRSIFPPRLGVRLVGGTVSNFVESEGAAAGPLGLDLRQANPGAALKRR
jgi:hypothetical protein